MLHHKRRIALFSVITLFFSLVFVFFLLFLFLKDAIFPQKKPVVFGSTYMTMDNQYFEVLNSYIESLVEANGDVLITRDGANSQQKQNEQILDMLNMGVDFIFINPVDAKLAMTSLAECERRKVPYIAVDSSLEGRGNTMQVGTVVSDNYAAGALVAQDLMRNRKSAKIVVFYDKNIESTCTRFQGFLDTLNAQSFDYRILFTAFGTTLLHETMIEAQKFLNLQLDFDTIFGSNDPAALGSLAAIQHNNMWHSQLVYGIDGSPASKMMISQGFMQASAAQFPSEIAKTAVNAAYRYVKSGERLGLCKVGVQLVTKENVSDFNIMGWQ